MRRRPPILLEQENLQVCFEWTGDRYRHDILIGGVVVASSIEGDASDEVPPSPPLQDLSLESLGGGMEAIMGVGAAGRGHWSISVVKDDPVGLLFELACRGDVPQIGSQYQILGDVEFIASPTAAIESEGMIRPVERLVGTNVWTYRVRRSV